MGAPVYSSPVVSNGTLYIGTQTHLYAIGKVSEKSSYFGQIMNRKVIGYYFFVLFMFHQDFWWWDDRVLIFGFLPMWACLSCRFFIALCVARLAAIKYAWPHKVAESLQKRQIVEGS